MPATAPETIADFIRRRVPWKVIDAAIVAMGYYSAFFFRFLATPTQDLLDYLAPLNAAVLPLIVLYLGVNHLWGIDRRVWRYASSQELVSLALAGGASTFIALVLDLVLGLTGVRPLPLSVVALGGFFTLSGLVVVRYRSRLLQGMTWRWHAQWGNSSRSRTRALIYGAGETGQLVAWRLVNQQEGEHYHVVGFVDDDPTKKGLRVHEIEVIGGRRDLAAIVEREQVELIILAMSHITGENMREVLSACQETPAQIKIVPNVFDWMAQPNTAPLLREVGVEDLLGRKPITMDQESCRRVLEGKRVLVTGGCGSIGAELCRQIAPFGPRPLVVLDNNETGLYDLEIELRGRFPSLELAVVVGDVTDQRKMDRLFQETLPQVIFHAAAYKHVPLMEHHPEEAVRVNIGGTRVLVDTALRHGAERFLLVSTDKAVNPSSVMGATKRLAEMLVLNSARKASGLHSVVRFGNVLGSRGSVVPTFAKQIELGGPVTVTHPEATRYFMDLSEAVNLILQAATLAQGGDTFMLDMGQRIRVDDLARKMIRMRGLRPDIDIPIVYVGMRPGEKLHEELLAAEEERKPTAHPQVYQFQDHQPLDEETLQQSLEDLTLLATMGDREALTQRLFRLSLLGARAGAGSTP